MQGEIDYQGDDQKIKQERHPRSLQPLDTSDPAPTQKQLHRPHALQLFLHPVHKPPCAHLKAFSFHAYGGKAPVGSGESNPRNLRLRAEAPEEAPTCNSSPVQKFQPGQPILTWVLSTPSESPPHSLEPGVTGQEDSGSWSWSLQILCPGLSLALVLLWASLGRLCFLSPWVTLSFCSGQLSSLHCHPPSPSKAFSQEAEPWGASKVWMW